MKETHRSPGPLVTGGLDVKAPLNSSYNKVLDEWGMMNWNCQIAKLSDASPETQKRDQRVTIPCYYQSGEKTKLYESGEGLESDLLTSSLDSKLVFIQNKRLWKILYSNSW